MIIGTRREEGFALITALWASLILALLASYVVVITRRASEDWHIEAQRARLAAISSGFLEQAKLRLLDPSSPQPPLDGSPVSSLFQGYKLCINYQDQAGMFDINFVDQSSLVRLLHVVGGLDTENAEGMADRILDWRDRGPGRRLNGAKGPDYASAGALYGPREGNFESKEELKLVLGMTSVLFGRLAPALTVYSQKDLIDPSVAPRPVLLAMPGMTEELVDELLAQRRQKAAAQQSTQGLFAGLFGHAITISATAVGGGTSASIIEVIRVIGSPSQPFWVYFTDSSY